MLTQHAYVQNTTMTNNYNNYVSVERLPSLDSGLVCAPAPAPAAAAAAAAA